MTKSMFNDEGFWAGVRCGGPTACDQLAPAARGTRLPQNSSALAPQAVGSNTLLGRFSKRSVTCPSAYTSRRHPGLFLELVFKRVGDVRIILLTRRIAALPAQTS